jgi:phthalate 4,5-dioxygenase
VASAQRHRRIPDRTREHLGSTGVAVIRMHRQLLRAAKGLAEGAQPPALGGSGDFRSIRAAEKVLAEGEDWRVLGTSDDPIVQEALDGRGSGRQGGMSVYRPLRGSV